MIHFMASMDEKASKERGITGAVSVVGSATVVSRVLGYIRDGSIAYVFGAGMFTDAFFVAFRVSNLLRRLVGEGALTSSFIPIFTEEYGRRTRSEARDLVSNVFTVFGVILLVLCLLGIIFSEGLVSLISPGFREDPGKFSLTVDLTRLMFPYMVFVGLMAVCMGVLNSLKIFAVPAIAPVFFNLAIIFSVFALAPFLGEPVYALAIGVLMGGLLQFAVHLPAMKRHGFSPLPLINLKDPAMGKIFKLMGPAAFGVGVYQLNIFVTLWFASALAEGSVSYLYYSGRLIELPLGVFGVAVTTAVLPSLSEHVARKEWDDFKGSLSFALRLVTFVTVPATVGLLVLGGPIIEVLFRRGEFTPEASRLTSAALFYYALGIVPVSVYRILVSVFYSIKDTVTPVVIAFVTFVLNVAFSFVLVGPLGHGGLALATSLSSLIYMIILFAVLKNKFGHVVKDLVLPTVKCTAASLAMGAFLLILVKWGWAGSASLAAKGGFLLFSVLSGALVYIVFAWLLGVREVKALKDFVPRR